jgi:hypothetical protein
LEAFEEIADTIKDLNKRIIACTDTGNCLIDPYLRKIQFQAKELHTSRRTSTPTKIAFAGGNGT